MSFRGLTVSLRGHRSIEWLELPQDAGAAACKACGL